jgi:hypothetical protein
MYLFFSFFPTYFLDIPTNYYLQFLFLFLSFLFLSLSFFFFFSYYLYPAIYLILSTSSYFIPTYFGAFRTLHDTTTVLLDSTAFFFFVGAPTEHLCYLYILHTNRYI